MTKTELLQMMEEIFHDYNTKYFEGKISTPIFKLFHKQRTLGTYFTSEHAIGLTDYYINGMSRHDVEEIMAHEMVHAYLHETHNEDRGAHYHHGPRFYALANKVNYLSKGYLHISRCTKLSCGTEKTKRNTDDVTLIIAKTYDGRYVVGRIASRKLDYFMGGWLKKYYSEITPFYAIDGNRFGHLVLSQSRFNYRFYTKEALESDVLPYVRRIQCRCAA